MAASQSTTILDALKRSAAILRDADIDFALGGGLSAWVRGGPPTENDIDLLIQEADVDAALAAFFAAGLPVERPPEGWLVKAWDGDVLIDLMYEPSGIVVDDAYLAHCEVLNVAAVRMRVMPVDDLLVGKLLALTEHHLDLAPILEHARALREQVNWEAVIHRTMDSPFARAFFVLLREMRILDDLDGLEGLAPSRWLRAG